MRKYSGIAKTDEGVIEFSVFNVECSADAVLLAFDWFGICSVTVRPC
jgi:hypothetical protein